MPALTPSQNRVQRGTPIDPQDWAQEEIERIREALEVLIQATPPPEKTCTDFYAFSYPKYLSVFEEFTSEQSWSEDKVMVGLSVVYVWMPRIARSFDRLPEALTALPDLLNARSAPAELVPVALCCIDNSAVAGSKFLHLYDPSRYPIYDSFVEGWMWANKPSGKRRNQVMQERYFHYIEAVAAVSDETKDLARAWSRRWFGYETSSTRAIEAIVFYDQRNNQLPRVKGRKSAPAKTDDTTPPASA